VVAKPDKPCDVAKALLTDAVTRLREGPPQHEQPAGSFVAVDPCALAPADDAQPILGPVLEVEPVRLHECRWEAAGSVTLNLATAKPPTLSKDPAYDGTALIKVYDVPVYLAKKFHSPESSSCTLTWRHRMVEGGTAEVGEVRYTSSGPLTTDEVCARAQDFTELVLVKLPRT
jgi:hypothetical protein